MAIKGKGKTRSKQPARAPRHEPVPVKPPFGRRTWVRVTAAFIAGVFLLSVTWWVWENLDKNSNAKAAAARTASQRQAIAQWKAKLEPALQGVGQLQGGAGPQIATQLGPVLDALSKGTDPKVTADDLTTLAKNLDDAANALAKITISDVITGHGFDRSQSDVITAAQSEMIGGLRSLHVAAQLAALAIQTPGKQAALADAAKEAYATGQDLIERGWTRYVNVSAAAGVQLPLPQGLPAGSGS